MRISVKCDTGQGVTRPEQCVLQLVGRDADLIHTRTLPTGLGGSPRVYWAWPLAWPPPSGPPGWQRSPGSTARRRRVPRSGMRSTVEAGGASPDNARRSGPVALTFHGSGCIRRDVDGLIVVLAGAAARYGGDRRRPVTGDAVCGSRRAVGLASEGRGESCRPATARPRVNPGRLWRVTLAALPSRLVAPVLAVHGQGRQARRAEGAPLIIVKKILTTTTSWVGAAPASATRTSRSGPRLCGPRGRR